MASCRRSEVSGGRGRLILNQPHFETPVDWQAPAASLGLNHQ